MINCKYCGEEMKFKFSGRRVFCSEECSKAYRNKRVKAYTERISVVNLDTLIEAHKKCNSADGNCNQCPYGKGENCTIELEKDTLKALIRCRDESKKTSVPTVIDVNTSALSDSFISQIKRQIKLYSAKKQAYKSGTMLYQYWLGKEEALKEILKWKDV